MVRMMPHLHVIRTFVLAAIVSLTACSSPRTNAPWARPYPENPTLSGTADIQVVRDGTQVSMTNTTAREFGPSTVWINMQWSLPIDGFKPGQTLTLDLSQFRNEHQERFRAGGLFSAERPDMVALTQIETAADGPATAPSSSAPAGAATEFVGLVTVRGAGD